MANQHVLFAETITAMKKARKRRAYESDSDSEIDYHGNRGFKLKKKARFAHQGQLAPPSGPQFYREVISHAGHQRAIISRNPLLLDDDGYEIDSDDDHDDHVLDIIGRAAELNPYANLHLESVLAPLTAVTDLPTHPTLSRPYTSKTLTQLTKQGCNIMHKENAALWKVKHLQTKIIGDHNWAPCELMVGPNDIELYRDDYVDPARPDANKIASAQPSINGDGPAPSRIRAPDGRDVPLVDAEPPPDMSETNKTTNADGETDGQPQSTSGSKEGPNSLTTNGAVRHGDVDIVDHSQEAERQSTSELSIHPIFLPPRSARPDRDLGIPEIEAEDMRRLLQLYVQKQEEVCRGVKRLYEGLLRADRMRKTVLSWSKHEAHVGPNRDMSDGEDWYDKEEWGLEEDLKKGQDEEEDETPQTTKKTRARR
ncbi:hypothetical protein F5Y16DRAFT_391817 [Xylariaceae sp. FL0255]|nr:hypothetical protein F5Y16DRAFT_391817 [Xylariaceae sp. FL0255]